MEKENSEFEPVKLRLKIDLVSYPALAEGLVNMIMIIIIITSCEFFTPALADGLSLEFG